MSAPRARLVLHIGQHKTGSKALQFFLAAHAGNLAEQGIFYPLESNPTHGIRAYSASHYRLYALLRAEAMSACGDTAGAARFHEEKRPFCESFKSAAALFASWESERSRIGAHTIVISAEDLFDMQSAHETGFSMNLVESGAGLLARAAREFGYDPVVVAYVRRQDHLLGAHYVQFIKGSGANNMEFDAFAGAFAARLRTRDILMRWATAFGPDRVRVRPFESAAMPSGIVADFFERQLGFPVPTGWPAPPRDPETVNATPDRDYVEFIRCLNRKSAQGEPVFPREDVLEAALEDRSEAGTAGIFSWMSPKSRRELLAVHESGNAELARRFAGLPDKPLFAEPAPAGDENWRPYPGLSAIRAAALESRISEIGKRHAKTGPQPPGKGWHALISRLSSIRRK